MMENLDELYNVYSEMLQNDFLMPDINPKLAKESEKLRVKNTTKNKKKTYNIPNVSITRHNHIGQ